MFGFSPVLCWQTVSLCCISTVRPFLPAWMPAVSGSMTPDNTKCADACVPVSSLRSDERSLGSVGEGFYRMLESLRMNADTSCQPLSSHCYTVHRRLINCSFCSCRRYAENFWDSFNPSSLPLITLDAQEALFSFPLRCNILFDVGLKWVRRTHRNTL